MATRTSLAIDMCLARSIFSLGFAVVLLFPELPAPAQQPPAPAPQADADVAKKLNITPETVARIREMRALTNQQLVVLPQKALKSTMRRLNYADIQNERHAFRLLQEQDEQGVIPPNALMRAARQLNQMKQQVPANQRTAGVPAGRKVSLSQGVHALTAGIEPSGWLWKGPGNIGGRTRSILVHPTVTNRMWLGSVGGGIWSTNDGGANWAPVDDFMANLAVCCMAMNPTNANEMYAGTGEGFFSVDAIRGAGIFRSADGGATWNQLPTTINDNFRNVNRLSISADGQVILAATRAGIFRNSSAGAGTWSKQQFGDFVDVDFHPTDSTRAIAGTRTGGAIVSSNGGMSWTSATGLPSSGRVEVTYAVKDPSVVYASAQAGNGRLFRSSNGGQSYTLRNSTTQYLGTQGWYDNVVWAGDTTNEDFVIVGGIDLWRSTDGGSTLNQISTWWASPQSAHADHHFVVAHPMFDGSGNKTVFFGNDGGIYKTTDVYQVGNNPDEPFTNGWLSLNNNYGVTQLYGAAGSITTGTLVAGAQDNGTLRYTTASGPLGWIEMFGGDGGYCAADPQDSNRFYGEYVYLNIHRSDDGGASSDYISGQFWNGFEWTFKPAPFRIPDAANNNANFIAPFILDPNNSNRILGGGLSLWRTNDAKTANMNTSGPRWSEIKTAIGANRFQDAISAIAVGQGNSDLIWVGHNNGNVYRSANGMAATPTWERVDDGATPLPNRYCHRITIDPRDHMTVYATFGGYETGNVWKSTDGGADWHNLGVSLPQAPVRSLVVHPDNSLFIYIGTEVGVLASEDGGATWSPTNEGPTNCSVDELIWMGKKLVAATHGRGVFEIDLSDRGGVVDAPNRLAAARVLLEKLEERLNQVTEGVTEMKTLRDELKRLLSEEE